MLNKKNSKFKLYADDTVIYFSGKDLNATECILQQDLDSISNWCIENCLTINQKN